MLHINFIIFKSAALIHMRSASTHLQQQVGRIAAPH